MNKFLSNIFLAGLIVAQVIAPPTVCSKNEESNVYSVETTLRLAKSSEKKGDLKNAAAGDVQSFEDAERKKLNADLYQYISQVKTLLEFSWHPPRNNKLEITKVTVRIEQSGKVVSQQVTNSSILDSSATATLATLPPLPSQLKSTELFLSFMSDGQMNVVDVISPPTRREPYSGQSLTEIDFGPYMADLQRRIKRTWFPPKGHESQPVSVVFKIHSEGEMTDLELLSPSPVKEANEAALEAVRKAAPFRPLPDGAKSFIEIQFTFDYNILAGGGHATLRIR